MWVNVNSNKDINFYNDIKKLVDYVYHDEKLHYMAQPSRDHIYLIIRRLAKQIGYRFLQ